MTARPLETWQLQALAERHGLPFSGPSRPFASGAANAAYLLNPEVVLRVAHSSDQAAVLDKEARLLVLARQAGVRTPGPLASGLVPGEVERPYLLLTRVEGNNLGALGLPPASVPDVYRELGRDLARWHLRPVGPTDPLTDLPRDDHPDPRPGLAALVEQGILPADAAGWLTAWLDRLAPVAASR